jgi:hypothetical protein
MMRIAGANPRLDDCDNFFQSWQLAAYLRGDMKMNWNRGLSGIVFLIYFVVAYAGGGGGAAFMVMIFCALPLACIWFGEAMGGYTGQGGTIGITAPSPGIIVCILGWWVLLLPVIGPVIGWVFS